MRVNVNCALYGRCYAVARRFMLAAFLCCFFYGSTDGRDSIPVVSADGNGDGAVDSPVKPLSVGDEVPDISFEMINYPKSTAKLSDFRGKLVILDFWGTFCTSCIATFPEEMELKRQFGDKVEILLVNSYEKKEKVEDFLKSFAEKKGVKLTLPMVVRDSVAKELFPHTGVPHCVWINENGQVIAITSAGEIDKEHIVIALQGKRLNWLVKDDYVIGDYSKPYLLSAGDKTEGVLVDDKAALELYNLGSENRSTPISIFTKALKMDYSVDGSVSNNKYETTGRRIINQPLLRFFQYGYDVRIPPVRWIFECDTTLFEGKGGVPPVYCFELVAQDGLNADAVKNLIKLDLYKAFGLTGCIEKRIVNCNEVVLEHKYYNKGSLNETGMQRIALGDFIERLNSGSDSYLLGDNDKDALLLVENQSIENLYKLEFGDVEKILRRNGYSLKQKQCEIECFIIKEQR
ncbi:hypothetical protein DCC81_08495 [Chitinophaga parva]|uniref:Thioredoxin domain-containing protein n=1 Tax=Chitinophaga parva TaxID=2169414 RepID=A0A2T7BP71_9BACT|nr:TlpA disulfide reductase family protein [Chitinophaga parva]PUZ29473.1 hypothetical protein DCC81_08495 [Chitinophaga parva]